ncbi:PREDICTED: E3 ubiquitin-protein ligase ATL42-like isoform X3 [Ipomoea nil]|uniref:E3 ubiquitin-protein ligase ATL42-like isoform X3 n=1 Tax=Ipomoea nil TaxID=35883 RepID=UPI000900CEBE|nr:PREDICTED: E3 ubiquitin-protein ligase ATL42-like isoform X3 [Ipomoea nil]
MNMKMIILVQLMVFLSVKAQEKASAEEEDTVNNFEPSLAVVIGILSVIFSLTFSLLLYAKFCHRPASSSVHHSSNLRIQDGLVRSRSRFSGIDKTVVESLPFFRFSSLKGSREGLECSVCLARFEDVEILRLLPKCKHAFHIACIDQWLDNHSTCPLCRHKIRPEDLSTLQYSNSLRFLGSLSLNSQSELRREDSNLELYIHREENINNSQSGSSRFSILSSFRKPGSLHSLNHRINIVSEVVLKNRWSNVSSSDLMFLSSEMIHDLATTRFSSLDRNSDPSMAARVIEEQENPNKGAMNIKEEIERKRQFEIKIKQNYDSSFLPSSSEPRIHPNASQNQKRSMSEIVTHPRNS